jgi:hypothetical protein
MVVIVPGHYQTLAHLSTDSMRKVALSLKKSEEKLLPIDRVKP